MTPSADDDDLPRPNAEDSPNAMVWLVAGFLLILAYVVALLLLSPRA